MLLYLLILKILTVVKKFWRTSLRGTSHRETPNFCSVLPNYNYSQSETLTHIAFMVQKFKI